MHIGEQRRTIYIEPIEEEPGAWPLNEPSPAVEPAPTEPERSPEPEPALPA
ncbi:MAG: hypothetical protein ACRDHM_07330 [Actinomycetota bacterium]